MAQTNVKISDLPILAEVSDSDIVAIVSGGVTYRMTVENLLAAVNDAIDRVDERVDNIGTGGGGGGGGGYTSGLPAVTAADNGKILMVVGGTWAAAELANLEEVLF